MEDIINIDTSTCSRDGICKDVCPVDVIEFSEDGFPGPSPDAEEICIRCGHCVSVCPTGSFGHREVGRDLCPPVQKELLLTTVQCAHFLRSRRSVRAYEDKPVPRDLLQQLIEMARYAPSAHNSQKVHWLVFGNREEINSLAGITADWMRWVIKTMPERAAELHLARRVRRWESGKDGILRGAPVLIIAHGEKVTPLLPDGYTPELGNVTAPLDYTIAMTYLELAATSLGLGACWAGYLYRAANTFPAMHEALCLPEGHQCFGAMMVGYPKYKYKRMPHRNPPAITWRL